MDPLSAIKMNLTPDLGANAAGGLQDLTPKTISLTDLQKLDLGSSSGAGGAAGAASGIGNTQTGGSFSNLLGNFVGEVNDKQAAASDAITGLMSGQNVSLHQAMISMEEANVSFQMMVEVRNKLLDSYQELMRMQV